MFLTKASLLLVATVCLVSCITEQFLISSSKANEVDSWVDDGRDYCPWTGPTCISNCVGKRDGDYQSCRGCSIYASCVAGRIYDNRPCPGRTVWDDKLKRCNTTSHTCFCYPEPETCRWTGWSCIRSCHGLPDGDYQSCHGCSIYVSCVGGTIIDYRPCAPANPPLQWDDISSRCEYRSRSCKCYSDSEIKQDRMNYLQILKK